jgi:PncC family amidohydrolase
MMNEQMPLEERIGPILRKKGLVVVTAESCTGGLIGHRITNIPGSSDYYLGSVTAYANETKERLLGVRAESLASFGAVSRETAIEMAAGIRRALSGDFPLDRVIGISTTGIAGPGGEMPGKPVGLVWIGMSAAEGEWAWRFDWKGNRVENKELSASAALQLLWNYLQGDLTDEAWVRRLE